MAPGSDSGGQARPSPAPRVTAQEGQRQTLGKYEIQKKIGSGGMGAVFLARDLELKRTVALKLLPKDKAQNPQLLKRFKAEAQAAAQLRHENIVSVYEAGELDGYAFIALEYVDGKDLHQYVSRRGPLPVKRSVEIVSQVARALQHAHEQNVVHRDIKPSNLLIRKDGTVKVTDLGLARVIDETTETGITRAGTTVGTVDYMAPEQAKSSKAADIRSDIYSLGCAWYQMLTGLPPYPEGSVTNKLAAHATSPPPDPRDKNDAVPEGVVAVMHRMMAKRPEDRYQTPAELLEDLTSAHLTRTQVGADVLAALASDGTSSAEASTADALPESGHGRLPPGPGIRKGVRMPSEKKGISLESLKYLIVAGIVVGMISLVYWVSTQFSKVFDSSGGTAGAPTKVESRLGEEGSHGAGRRITPKPGHSARPDEGIQPRDVDPETPEAGPVASVQERPGRQDRAADRISIGRPEEREVMPEWIADVASPGDEPEGPVITVSRDPRTSPKFKTIGDALNSLAAGGGVIELHGEGPFPLEPTQLEGRHRVAIRAAQDSRPVIVLQPGENQAEASLRLNGGTLELSGLHFVLPAQALAGSGDRAIIDVVAGSHSLRQCSITVLGSRGETGRIVAIRLNPPPGAEKSARDAAPARILVDGVCVCGDDVHAVEMRGAAGEFVAWDSLFACGRGSILSARGAEGSHTAYFLSCTGATSGTAFVIDGVDSRLVAMNSVFAAPQKAADASPTLLSLEQQPAGSVDAKGPTVDTRTCLFSGWARLMSPDDAADGDVTTAEQWQRHWNLPNGSVEVRDGRWPAPSAAPSALTPTQFQVASLGPVELRAADGSPIGAAVDRLATPSGPVLERVEASLLRPPVERLPFGRGEPPRVINVDLTRQDLGALVSKGDWPDGARIAATGGGTVKSSPIRFSGKSLRIEFTQSGDQPLVIETKSTDYRSSDRPFISVEKGTIELIGGRFKIPASSRGNVPLAFLSVTDGSFLIDDCYILGPMTESPGHETLIRWIAGAAAGEPYAHFGVVNESYLADTRPVLTADMPGQALVMRGSIAVALDDLIVCRVPGGASTSGAAVDVDHCTLSSTSAAFDVQTPPEAQGEPIRFFVSNTVFAPPVESAVSADGSFVLRDKAGGRERGLLQWWGEANGFATELKGFLAGAAAASPDERLWGLGTGAGQAVRSLSGRDGVVMKEPYPARTKLGPRDFALRDGSQAARWGDDGEAIGADVGRVAAAETQPKAPAARRPAAPSGVKSNF